MDFTREPPFPDACRTGRAFITPCYTASLHEFLVDGELWLAFHVAGHGWQSPRRGRIENVNDTGTLAAADGSERSVFWKPDP